MVDGPLHSIIQNLYGHDVLAYDGAESTALSHALENALLLINKSGIEAKRVNEVGNAVEPLLIQALAEAGFAADRPMTTSGQRRSSGYPDLEASRGGKSFYFEIKTYHPSTVTSTQRTFYLSPSDDPKVTHDGYHLLIGFAIEPSADGLYFAKSVRLVDLRELPVRLKIEFNASNRDLYQELDTILLLEAAESLPKPKVSR